MTSPPAQLPAVDRLRPYVGGLASQWLETSSSTRHRRIDGSLAFVDISGFTTLTERLAAKGKVGAEEMSDLLNAAFAQLLEEAYAYGASLVKWGGDAVLLLFEGDDHARLACRAAYEMRATMRRIGRLRTSVGVVQLKMSVGIDSGSFDFFFVGTRHHELLVAGPAATATAVMEQTAEAGEIVVSRATAALLPAGCVGLPKGEGMLLRAAPKVWPRTRFWTRGPIEADVGSCVDPAIADHLLTEVGESEHRQVAVAFVEVSGVDDLLQRQGPGAVASALHDLITVVQEECAQHAVTFWETDISKDGFKIMLVAGAPRSSGRDEEGMLRATRTILDRHAGPISVRIGVNAGRVFNGGFGPPFRRTWSVKGDAINLAARVMGKAAPGELLATATLLARIAADADAEPLPPFMVKGKQHPVHASRVFRVRDARDVIPARDQPFVGRQREVALLAEAARTTATGAGTAVAIVGEPGIGKSRLVDHVCGMLSPGLTVVRGFGDAYRSSTPYFAARRLLRSALGIAADAADDEVVAALTRRTRAAAPGLIDFLPLVALPFGVELPDTAESAAVQDEFRRARTVRGVVELLAATVTAPTAFVVDDVQHADDASIELLARMADAARTRPWLVVLAGREVQAAAVEQEIVLQGLAPGDAHELLVSGAQGAPLAPHVLRELVVRADGNPLFLQELAAVAGETGGDQELPSSLEELLAAQIDHLAPNERRLLRTVSVLGSRFDPKLVAEVVDVEPSDDDWSALDRFLTRHADGTFRFRTSLARDAAYEGLPFRRRVDLHGRTATALEEWSRADGLDRADALSLHCFAAQRHSSAWHYSRVAGRRAQRAFANVEALAFLRRARLAARRIGDVAPEELAELVESIGDVCARLADLEAAATAYREARRIAPASATALRARVALSAGIAATRAGHPSQTARWFAVAEHELERAEDLLELRARVTVERAMLRHRQGRHREAAALCARAIELGEAAGADLVVGRALTILDANDLAVGARSDDSRLMRALALFERIGDLPRQAAVWNQLGVHAYFAGDWDQAVERYEQARGLHERIGDEWNAATNSFNLAEILVDQGRLAEAEPLAADALRVWRASKTPLDIGYGVALLARVHARSGRVRSALELLQEAVDAFRLSNERFDLLDAELRVAEALVLHGAAAAAGAKLTLIEKELWAALRAAGVVDATVSELPESFPQTAQLARLRGYALGQAGDTARARSALTQALESARRRGAVHDTVLALDALVWLSPDASLADERDALRSRLGIVWTPEVPRRAVAEKAQTPVVLPRQRAEPPRQDEVLAVSTD